MNKGISKKKKKKKKKTATKTEGRHAQFLCKENFPKCESVWSPELNWFK